MVNDGQERRAAGPLCSLLPSRNDQVVWRVAIASKVASRRLRRVPLLHSKTDNPLLAHSPSNMQQTS